MFTTALQEPITFIHDPGPIPGRRKKELCLGICIHFLKGVSQIYIMYVEHVFLTVELDYFL